MSAVDESLLVQRLFATVCREREFADASQIELLLRSSFATLRDNALRVAVPVGARRRHADAAARLTARADSALRRCSGRRF